jgi:hypothetical protein
VDWFNQFSENWVVFKAVVYLLLHEVRLLVTAGTAVVTT